MDTKTLTTQFVPLAVIFISATGAVFFFVDLIKRWGNRIADRGSDKARGELVKIEEEGRARSFYLRRVAMAAVVFCLGTYGINVIFGLVLGWIVYLIPGVMLR